MLLNPKVERNAAEMLDGQCEGSVEIKGSACGTRRRLLESGRND